VSSNFLPPFRILPTEDQWVREHAGLVLLDFQVPAYEQALLEFAQHAETAHDADPARGIPSGLAFVHVAARLDS